MAAICTVIASLSLFATLANVGVVVSFARDPKLRSAQNCYILNLAAVDLVIAVVVTPFSAADTLLGYYWLFSKAWCKLWLTADFTASMVGALTIMLISHDRYCLVKDAIAYRNKATVRRALIKIAVIWMCSFLLYGPAIFFWEDMRGFSVSEPNECEIEFVNIFSIVMLQSVVEFAIPFLLILFFSVQIYWLIRRRTAALAKLKVPHATAATVEMATCSQGAAHAAAVATIEMATCSQKAPHAAAIKMGTYSQGAPSAAQSTASTSLQAPPRQPAKDRKKYTDRELLTRDQRVAKNLVVLVGIFFVMWLPFIIYTMITAACEACENDLAYALTYWWLYYNACINPFIYAYASPRFRHNFRRLWCRCVGKSKVGAAETVAMDNSMIP